MARIQICAEQVSTVNPTYSATVTCESPRFTPIGAGDECHMSVYNVSLDAASSPMTLSFSFNSEFEYQYLDHGVTFNDYCSVNGQSGSITLPTGLTQCCCGLTPTYVYSYSCNAAAITTTSTMVQGPVSLAFTVSNLCSTTLICINTEECP